MVSTSSPSASFAAEKERALEGQQRGCRRSSAFGKDHQGFARGEPLRIVSADRRRFPALTPDENVPREGAYARCRRKPSCRPRCLATKRERRDGREDGVSSQPTWFARHQSRPDRQPVIERASRSSGRRSGGKGGEIAARTAAPNRTAIACIGMPSSVTTTIRPRATRREASPSSPHGTGRLLGRPSGFRKARADDRRSRSDSFATRRWRFLDLLVHELDDTAVERSIR